MAIETGPSHRHARPSADVTPVSPAPAGLTGRPMPVEELMTPPARRRIGSPLAYIGRRAHAEMVTGRTPRTEEPDSATPTSERRPVNKPLVAAIAAFGVGVTLEILRLAGVDIPNGLAPTDWINPGPVTGVPTPEPLPFH